MAMTTAEQDWTNAPYAEWIEDVIREMVQMNPCSIAMVMITEDGDVSTCSYNVNMNDRDIMIGAMQDENRMRWFKEHREELASILSDDWIDDEDDDVDDENGAEDGVGES